MALRLSGKTLIAVLMGNLDLVQDPLKHVLRREVMHRCRGYFEIYRRGCEDKSAVQFNDLVISAPVNKTDTDEILKFYYSREFKFCNTDSSKVDSGKAASFVKATERAFAESFKNVGVRVIKESPTGNSPFQHLFEQSRTYLVRFTESASVLPKIQDI